jgi:hypothetical protein
LDMGSTRKLLEKPRLNRIFSKSSGIICKCHITWNLGKTPKVSSWNIFHIKLN